MRHVVVGGFAVNAHGYLRASEDLDIVPTPSPRTSPSDVMQWLAGIDAEFLFEELSSEAIEGELAGDLDDLAHLPPA